MQTFRVSGAVVALAWGLTLIAGWFGYGRFLGFVVEGNNASLLSRLPLVLPTLCLLVTLALTVVWARSLGTTPGDEPGEPASARRRFLVGGVTVLGGLVATAAAAFGRNLGWITVTGKHILIDTPKSAAEPLAEWQGAEVRDYRRLGRTNVLVSDISLGSGRIKPGLGEEVARLAMERGVNYFDTSPDYSEAGSETTLGKAMLGKRDKMFVATKFCTPQGDLPAGSSVQLYMEMVEGSLKRLGSWTRTRTRPSTGSRSRGRCASWASRRTRRISRPWRARRSRATAST
jgi:hypothetical protein